MQESRVLQAQVIYVRVYNRWKIIFQYCILVSSKRPTHNPIAYIGCSNIVWSHLLMLLRLVRSTVLQLHNIQYHKTCKQTNTANLWNCYGYFFFSVAIAHAHIMHPTEFRLKMACIGLKSDSHYQIFLCQRLERIRHDCMHARLHSTHKYWVSIIIVPMKRSYIVLTLAKQLKLKLQKIRWNLFSSEKNCIFLLDFRNTMLSAVIHSNVTSNCIDDACV